MEASVNSFLKTGLFYCNRLIFQDHEFTFQGTDKSQDKCTDGAGNEISRPGTSNVSFHNACGGKFISPAPFFSHYSPDLFLLPMFIFSVPLQLYFLLCSFTFSPPHILVAPFPHSSLNSSAVPMQLTFPYVLVATTCSSNMTGSLTFPLDQ
jgi:hypothetical protein